LERDAQGSQVGPFGGGSGTRLPARRWRWRWALHGLYLNPPEAVMALPLRPGVTPTGTNNGRCLHAARVLDAAMEIAGGTVIPQMSPWRRVLEFQRFLTRVDRVVPAVMGVDLILGISSTCAAPTIRRWLLDHPRVRLHFTPTESSW
jgi:hypothetical protein